MEPEGFSMHKAIALALLMAAGVGCGPPAPADFRGDYTGQFTNGTNTCPGNWNQGETNTASFVVLQSDANVTIEVRGFAGNVLDFVLGTRQFTGTAQGNQLNATLIGSRAQSEGMCTFTWRANVVATLSGDALQGTITYTPQTNGHADCTARMVEGCSRVQSFAATRPPMGGGG